MFVGKTKTEKSVVAQPTKPATIAEKAKLMKITSSAFTHEQKIPSKYTCDGENINPSLQFSEVPQQAKSLALIMDDPDAPMETWVHWTIFNMEPLTLGIEEGTKPKSGVEGVTSFGKPGYGGPCPPPASPEQLQRGESGTHRYFFKLYVLDTKLDLPATADKKQIEEKMQGHILDKAELIGLYSKQ